MTTTKQLHSKHSRQANGGKQYAIMKNKNKYAVVYQSDTVKVNGITYLMNDMVPRIIAAAIANYHPNNISEMSTAGLIPVEGRGTRSRYKVADCVALAKKKYSRTPLKQVA